MRILHTVNHYYPDCGGGAQAVVTQISERLAQRGHDVTVAATLSPNRKVFEHNGVKIVHFRIYGVLHHSALGVYGDLSRYFDYLSDNDFDVIMNYAAQTWGTDLTCRVLGSLHAKKVLAACGYSGLIGFRKWVYWRYFQRLSRYLRQYDAVVYHSANYRDKEFGDRHGITHYRVIPNGADATEFETSSEDFRQLYHIQSRYLLVSVGDHFTNKGHQRVLAAFQQLNHKDVTLVIIGRNTAPWYRSCRKSCQSEAARSGGKVLLLDNAPRSHVVAAYRAADVTLFGSYIEVFPLAVVESMASRTPFVAFLAGNVGEMAGGIVVNSVLEMVEETNRLLDNSALRDELGRLGYQSQRTHYEWELIVDNYESLYSDLVNGRRVQRTP
jgi:L-malate glycosyltransferase